MNREMTVKLGLVALLMMLLMIPLLLIGGLVEERQGLRDRVLEDIANSASRQQQVIGPLLVLPYRKTVREWKTHAKTGQRYEESHVRQGRLYFLPERLQVTSEVSSEPRNRGIYQALLYHSRNQFSGHFQVPANYGISADWADYVFDTPYLSVGISDIRGIESSLQLRWNEQTLAFAPGSGELLLESGVHADLPLPSAAGQQLAFTFDLALQGTRQLALSPLGRDSQWQMRADWPHPSFVGLQHEVDRYQDGAQPRQRKAQRGKAVRVARQHGHAVATPDAALRQAGRQARDQRVELGIGPARVAAMDGQLVR